MKYQVIADSSSDLLPENYQNSETGFSVVPLTLRIGENEYVDNENINKNEMLADLATTKGTANSACPSPQDWADMFKKAHNSFAVCISSKLSGTYNSALQARDLILGESPEKNIHVIDTKATAGVMIMATEYLMKLTEKGLDFEEIKTKVDEFVKQRTLIFSLENFNMLIKTGRMNKLVGFTASTLGIRAIARAEEGNVKVIEKARGKEKAFTRIVDLIEELCPNFSTDKEREVIINHCNNLEGAEKLRDMIGEKYLNVTKIRLFDTRGLCSFYASNGGLILSY